MHKNLSSAQLDAVYRQFVDNPLVGFFFADLDGRTLFVNEQLARMSGYTHEEAVGMNMLEHIAPESRAWLMERMLRRRAGEIGPDLTEAEMVHKDGSRYTCLVAPAALVDDEGNFAGFLGAMIDITEKKRLSDEIAERIEELRTVNQQLEEINSELDSFTHSMSHDLRLPLQTIKGYASLLMTEMDTRLDPGGRKSIRRIIEGVDLLDELIASLLAYSRLTRVEINLSPTDLNTVVENALNLLETHLRANRARVEVAGPLPEVVGHRTVLLQVLENLVSNAVKFPREGVPPRVKIWAEKKGLLIRLWVEDNGVGIAPEDHQRIFLPFERLPNGRLVQGCGVGLALVRKGVERMNGQVGVQSESGQGSRFFVELPAAPELKTE